MLGPGPHDVARRLGADGIRARVLDLRWLAPMPIGDVLTLIGPSSAQTIRGPGNFNAKSATLASAAGKRGRFLLGHCQSLCQPRLFRVDVDQPFKRNDQRIAARAYL